MTLTSLEFFLHICSVFEASILTMFSSLSILDMSEMSRFLMMDETSLMNEASSSLFFMIDNLDELMFASAMGIEIVKGAWLEVSHQSEWIK